ncbi:MAG: hypothetical protein ACR2O1_15540 [Boseongicola sp.]
MLAERAFLGINAMTALIALAVLLAIVFIALWFVWLMILRWQGDSARKWRRWAFLGILIGSALILFGFTAEVYLPADIVVARPWVFVLLNRIGILGGLLSGLVISASLVFLVIAGVLSQFRRS